MHKWAVHQKVSGWSQTAKGGETQADLGQEPASLVFFVSQLLIKKHITLTEKLKE